MFKTKTGLFELRPDFSSLLRSGAVIIDVRTEAEFKGGHVSGAQNYPLEQLIHNVQLLLYVNKPLITVCCAGLRSYAAADILRKSGIEAYYGGHWAELEKKLGHWEC